MQWNNVRERERDYYIFTLEQENPLESVLKKTYFFLSCDVANYKNHKHSLNVCAKPHSNLYTYPLHDLGSSVTCTECAFSQTAEDAFFFKDWGNAIMWAYFLIYFIWWIYINQTRQFRNLNFF